MEINSVVLIGRITRNAELKYTAGGLAVSHFSIAINRKKQVNNEWVDDAHFFDIVMMGKSAEAVHKYLTKGRLVGIDGELRQNRWEQDGQPRSKVDVRAEKLQLLGGEPGKSNTPEQSTFTADPGVNPDQFEDDIPF